MIKNKKDFKRVIELEKKLFFSSKKEQRFAKMTKDMSYQVWKYQLLLRKCEYYHLKNKFLYFIFRRKKNRLGIKLGIEIWDGSFDGGLKIEHPGCIVVNGNAKIGCNCTLFGDNCIGNDGKNLDAPIIGNNVKVGFGAKVLGGIQIADNVFIASGSVVVNNVLESNVLVAGVPAKIIRRDYK